MLEATKITPKKIFFLFIFLIKLILIGSNTCKTNSKVSNTDCFTDIIKFDGKNYRAGNAVVFENGELFIEYSLDADSLERLFYGLKKNGRNYFPNDSFVKTLSIYDYGGVKCRYESNNALVKFKDSSSNGKQYILSISTFRSLVEIYDTETWSYQTQNSINFLGHQIFSFEIPILEAKYNNEYVYFCAYSHYTNTKNAQNQDIGVEKGNYTSISRFKFSSLDVNKDYVTTVRVEEYKINDRVVSSFIIEEKNLIAVIVVKEFDGYYKFLIYFYNFDLSKAYNDFIKLYDDVKITNIVDGFGVYFKAIYLTNYYFAFAYFDDQSNNYSFKFRIIKLYKNGNLNEFEDKIAKDFNTYELSTDKTLNDFIKYDNERLVFISNKGYDNVIILLFYFSDTYSKMKVRLYSIDLEDYVLNKEMSINFWNDYLLFTPSYYVNGDGNKKIYSILMIFGFANGTDFTMDISPHLMDTGEYISGNDLVTRLLQNLTIDNNIFGYESTGK